MSANRTIPWRTLENWCGVLLVVGGILHLFSVGQMTLARVTAVTVPELIRDLTLAAGGIAGLLGLLGLAPRLRESLPRLTSVASIVAILGIVGLLSIGIGEPLIGGDEPPMWFVPLFLLYWLGLPLSFLVFGAASVYADTPSWSIGAVLLVVFLAHLVFQHIIPLHVGEVLAQVPSLVITGGLLVAGYLVRTQPSGPGSPEPASDAAMR